MKNNNKKKKMLKNKNKNILRDHQVKNYLN